MKVDASRHLRALMPTARPGDFARDRVRPSSAGETLNAAQDLVATALVQPLLDQMQNDPLRTELFHGGQAEDMFAQQMNTHLADRIVRSTRLPVVDAVYETLNKRKMQTGGAVNVRA